MCKALFTAKDCFFLDFERWAWVTYQLHLTVVELMHGAYLVSVNKVLAKNFANSVFTVVYSNLTLKAFTALLQCNEFGPFFHAGQLSPMGAKMEFEKTVS